jgi:hypothetical protein
MKKKSLDDSTDVRLYRMWVIHKYQRNMDIKHKCNTLHLHINIGG